MSGLEPLRRHAGIAAPLPADNVDTDAIFPARFIRRMDVDYARALFANWRFRDGARDEEPGFVLNQEPYRRASILVAGENFGCGSSREHAVWALREWGIRAVIARSFGDIFHGNCFKNAMLAIVLDARSHSDLIATVEGTAGQETVIDLEACRIVAPHGSCYSFEIDAGRRYQLLHGIDEIGLTLENAVAIEDFQRRQRAAQPWIWSGLRVSAAGRKQKP